jgi:DNA-binding Lrp family transcriptional regulator
MVPTSVDPGTRAFLDDLRDHDREVLEFLSQEPSTQVAFQGLRRRLGIHPEQLSRALHRLAEDELVERTELGYRVSRRALGILSPASLRTADPTVTILQTSLPGHVDLRGLVGALRGTWIGRLRWYGFAESDDGLRLGWALEDDSIGIEILVRPGQLTMSAKVDSSSRLDEATRLGYELFHHVSREISSNAGRGISA